jgi:hypothetical protein
VLSGKSRRAQLRENQIWLDREKATNVGLRPTINFLIHSSLARSVISCRCFPI